MEKYLIILSSSDWGAAVSSFGVKGWYPGTRRHIAIYCTIIL